jgi:hypothetical protein
MQQQIYKNIRFLLWLAEPKPERRDHWPTLLASWLASSDPSSHRDSKLRRAMEILLARGTQVTDQEHAAILRATDREGQDLFNETLWEGQNILQQNIEFLFAVSHHGIQVKVATLLGINKSTVHRWTSHKVAPKRKWFPALCEIFNLPSGTDLEVELVFLEPDNFTPDQKKTWLHSKVDQLAEDDLRLLYPALKRLLDDSNGAD